MSIDLSAFDQAVARVEIELNKETVLTTRKVALAADQAVVLATPVDSGRARANWLPSINSPRTETTENIDKSGANAIGEAQTETSGLKVGDSVYISNNLPYIGRLNDGHSQQAPAGFVEKAVQAAIRAAGS